MTASLGPSNDDSEAVEVEIDAAVYAIQHFEDGGWGGRLGNYRVGYAGWMAHAAACDKIPLGGDAGWLAREMATHEVRAERDADAFAWDISRPLAEQLAATAADDAAADALPMPGDETLDDILTEAADMEPTTDDGSDGAR